MKVIMLAVLVKLKPVLKIKEKLKKKVKDYLQVVQHLFVNW